MTAVIPPSGRDHHLGDRADAPVLAVAARDDEDAFGVADVRRDGRAHAGEEDAVVEGQEGKLHFESPLLRLK